MTNTSKVAKSTEEMRAMSETGGALETLGTTNIPEFAGRDAIHIAVIRRVAATTLYPGQHVDVDGLPNGNKTVGIVDPYLTTPVYPGSQFWLLLYPRSITGLRHVWTHPDFDNEIQVYEKPAVETNTENKFEEIRESLMNDEKFVQEVLAKHEASKPKTWRDRVKEFPESEIIVRRAIETTGADFTSFMNFLESKQDTYYEDYDIGFMWDGGDYITSLGTDAHGSIDDEVWEHIEKLTGRSFPRRAKYFSCSC